MQSTDQPKTDQPLPPPSQTSTAAAEVQSTGTATGTAETTQAGGTGASVGAKLRGAARVIHGAGEELRGSVLGAFDTMRGKDVSQAESGQIASKGREELHQGMEKLRPGHLARRQEKQAAKVGSVEAMEAQTGQPTSPPQYDEAAAGGPGRDVPPAGEKRAPLPQRDEPAATGAGTETWLGRDQPSQRTAGESEAGMKTGAVPGGYQSSYDPSAPGNVAASQEGQGVGQQTREETGGPPIGERGSPPTTTASQI